MAPSLDAARDGRARGSRGGRRPAPRHPARGRQRSRPAHRRRRACRRVIVLTAYDYPQYAEAALHLGAAGFVLKTAPLPELLDAIRRVAAGGLAFAVRPRHERRSGSRRASTTSSASWPTGAATTRSARRSGSARRPSRRTSRACSSGSASRRAPSSRPGRCARAGWTCRPAPERAQTPPDPPGPHGLSVPVRIRAPGGYDVAVPNIALPRPLPRPRSRRAPGSPDAVAARGRRRARHHRGGRAALDPHRVAAHAPTGTGSRSTSTSTRSTTRTSTRATSAPSSTSTTTTCSSSCTSRCSRRTPAGS